jgi:hypothetical protein
MALPPEQKRIYTAEDYWNLPDGKRGAFGRLAL